MPKYYELEKVPKRLWRNRKFILKAIKRDATVVFDYMDEKFKDDEEIVFEAIKREPILLSYASEIIKDNKDFILAAVKEEPLCFYNASERLQQDKDIALAARSTYAFIYKDLRSELQDDIDIIQVVIEQSIENQRDYATVEIDPLFENDKNNKENEDDFIKNYESYNGVKIKELVNLTNK